MCLKIKKKNFEKRIKIKLQFEKKLIGRPLLNLTVSFKQKSIFFKNAKRSYRRQPIFRDTDP